MQVKTFFDENNLDTSNINYERIPGQVIENYKFLPTSQEDIKESIELIKQIKGFNFEKLIQSIDSKVQNNKKSFFYSAKEISELMAYKDALKMYWDLEKITESENK